MSGADEDCSVGPSETGSRLFNSAKLSLLQSTTASSSSSSAAGVTPDKPADSRKRKHADTGLETQGTVDPAPWKWGDVKEEWDQEWRPAPKPRKSRQRASVKKDGLGLDLTVLHPSDAVQRFHDRYKGIPTKNGTDYWYSYWTRQGEAGSEEFSARLVSDVLGREFNGEWQLDQKAAARHGYSRLIGEFQVEICSHSQHPHMFHPTVPEGLQRKPLLKMQTCSRWLST